jgi:hypothetical protein
MRRDSALLTKLRIEVTNNPMAVQIEIEPLVPVRVFHTSEHVLVEPSRLINISDFKRR